MTKILGPSSKIYKFSAISFETEFLFLKAREDGYKIYMKSKMQRTAKIILMKKKIASQIPRITVPLQ